MFRKFKNHIFSNVGLTNKTKNSIINWLVSTKYIVKTFSPILIYGSFVNHNRYYSSLSYHLKLIQYVYIFQWMILILFFYCGLFIVTLLTNLFILVYIEVKRIKLKIFAALLFFFLIYSRCHPCLYIDRKKPPLKD